MSRGIKILYEIMRSKKRGIYFNLFKLNNIHGVFHSLQKKGVDTLLSSNIFKRLFYNL